MSGFGPQLSPLTPAQLQALYPGNFDQLLGRAKKGLDFSARETYTLGTLGTESNIFFIASVALSQANTTVAAYFLLPGRIKIPKIAVAFTAIGASGIGANSFNVVLGTGAYAQGNVPGNDNSSVPNVAYNSLGQPSGTGPSVTPAPAYAAGGGGICSNPAVAGQAMFAADVVLNATNFPNITAATGTGPTYGQLLVPTNPDAVWPNGGLLTLRFTTGGAAATITNFMMSFYDEPQPLESTFPAQQYPVVPFPEPGVDF